MKTRRIIAVFVLGWLVGAEVMAENSAMAWKKMGKIVIDGKMDENAWKNAPVNGPLVPLKKDDAGPVGKKYQTTYKVLYDDQGVYFGIRANEPDIVRLRKNSPKKLDAAVWSDDDLEVFIDTNRDRMEYYQFAVNPAGVKSDLYFIEAGNTGKSGYNPKWEVGTFIGEDFYSVEIFIPFAALHNQPLRAGRQDWLISICRQRLAGKEFALTRTNTSK